MNSNAIVDVDPTVGANRHGANTPVARKADKNHAQDRAENEPGSRLRSTELQRNHRSADGPAPEVARALITAHRAAPTPAQRESALDELVRGHLPLATTLARRYGNRGIDPEDLEQVAALALMKAIHRYDVDASTPFGAYATPTITGELRRYFRDHGWLVRPPRTLQEQRQQLVQAREALLRKHGRHAHDHELAAALDITFTELREIERAEQNLRPASLDAPAGDADTTLLELVQSSVGTVQVADHELRLVVREAVSKLPLVQQQLVHLRFTEGLTQRDIAVILELTPMAVSRLQKRTLQELAHQLRPLVPGKDVA